MKKETPAFKTARKSDRNHKGSGSRKPVRRKNFLKDVLGFRWLKKAMVGKAQEEPLDLLDQWILKKKVLSLFF